MPARKPLTTLDDEDLAAVRGGIVGPPMLPLIIGQYVGSYLGNPRPQPAHYTGHPSSRGLSIGSPSP